MKPTHSIIESRGREIRVRLSSGEHAVFEPEDLALLQAACALLASVDWRPFDGGIGGAIPAEISQTPSRGDRGDW